MATSDPSIEATESTPLIAAVGVKSGSVNSIRDGVVGLRKGDDPFFKRALDGFTPAVAVTLMVTVGVVAGTFDGLTRHRRSPMESLTLNSGPPAWLLHATSGDPFPFEHAAPRTASTWVNGEQMTLPWQPVRQKNPDMPVNPSAATVKDPRLTHGLGVVAGHGLHCDLRASTWLLPRINRGIPTAVFSARGSGVVASPFHTGIAAWLKGVLDTQAPSANDVPLKTRLLNTLGYAAQAGDFAKVANAAGYKRFVVVAESQSTVAALWAAAKYAAHAGNSSSPYSRIAGFVLTLVPTWGEHRMSAFHELEHVVETVYGGFGEAMQKNPMDCSPGFGCVSFAKLIGAKQSDCPSPHVIAELKGKIPPVLVLTNEEAEPAHPVENGKLVADLLGAEYNTVSTYDEAAKVWPGVIAKFVAKVAAGEGMKLEPDPPGPHLKDDNDKNYFSDVAPGLTLSAKELRRSSTMCTGDWRTYPQMVEGCKEYNKAKKFFPSVSENSKGWDEVWVQNPQDPGIELYQRTGLSVGECVKAGIIESREFLNFGDLVSI